MVAAAGAVDITVSALIVVLCFRRIYGATGPADARARLYQSSLHAVFGHIVLGHFVLLHRVLGHLALGHRVFLHRLFRHAVLGHGVLFHVVSKGRRRKRGKGKTDGDRSRNKGALFHETFSSEIYVALSRLSHTPNTSSSVSRCRKLAFASRICENGQALPSPIRSRFVSAPYAKTARGHFFEDFQIGQTIRHATPRTVTLGDVALYNGLFGARFAVQSSDV